MNSLKEKELIIRLYTDQFHEIIRPIMFAGFQSLYDTAFNVSPDNGIVEFLKFLKAITSWNDSMLKTEIERIKFESKMGDYLDQLFNIVIHTIIILMTMTPERKKSTIRCPDDVTLTRFVHLAYIHSAERLFSNNSLFVRTDNELTNQNNINEINSIIDDGIDTAITKLLPLKYILDNYIGDQGDVLTEQLQTVHTKISTDHAVAQLTEKEQREQESHSSSQKTKDIKSVAKTDKIIKRSEKDVKRSEKEAAKSDSEEEILINNDSIQQKSGEKSQRRKSEKRSVKKHEGISLSDIPNISVHKERSMNPEESEPYYKRKGKKLDVFSNREYTKVSSSNNRIDINKLHLEHDSGDVNTDVVRKYVNNKPKQDSELSMQNYVPQKRTNNTKV